MALPTTPPAQRFWPTLTAAMAARADAASGADKIVSAADVDVRLAQLRAADDRALAETRAERDQVRAELDRAEAAAAAAFADAETRSAEHVTEQRAALRTELRVLELAGRYDPERPLRIPATDTRVAALAALPFTITPVRATPGRGNHTSTAHPAHRRQCRRPKSAVVQHHPVPGRPSTPPRPSRHRHHAH
ncbi:MAG: hypothetical protein ACLPXZ_13855 [Mycobacterium sp.]